MGLFIIKFINITVVSDKTTVSSTASARFAAFAQARTLRFAQARAYHISQGASCPAPFLRTPSKERGDKN